MLQYAIFLPIFFFSCYYCWYISKGVEVFLHLDLDSFFASAHRAIDDSLIGIPLAVGSRSNLEIFAKERNHIKLINHNSGAFVTPVFDSKRSITFRDRFVDTIDGKEKIRGIVVTSTYEARAYGVKTGMSLSEALVVCPKLIVIPSNYPLYHKLSREIHEYLALKIPKIEQFSIDEWFGDVSGWIEDTDILSFTKELQDEIKDRYNLPISIGISKAKWIAKLATDVAKPHGIKLVDDIDSFIANIPIKDFPGIGRGYQDRLQGRGVRTLGDIKKHKELFYSWGKSGEQLYNRIHGIDNESIASKIPRKSIGLSRTFDAINDRQELKRMITILCRNITYMVEQHGVNPTIYYLKVNYQYSLKRKESVRVHRVFSEQLFKKTILEIFERIDARNYPAIKLCVSVSGFATTDTFDMFELSGDIQCQNVTHAMHKLREKFGLDIIKSGGEL